MGRILRRPAGLFPAAVPLYHAAMPFDVREFPAGAEAAARNRRLVGGWLLGVTAMVFVMIVLGGATRLNGAGLSIMEWAPLSGALPPLTEAEWQRLFRLYQQIPQYALLHEGFGLAGFRHIFWLEWTHRLWGRLVGLAFLGPLVWLWMQGAIERRLRSRLVLLFVLGGLQGAVGWFMVASGFFPDSIAVSPYRLVVHLVLALVLYAALLWTGLSELRPVAAAAPAAPRRMLHAAAALIGLTIVAGGFTAGLHAGKTYNTFPLMDGRLVPAGYADLSPVLRNLTENIAAVQFDHRLLATLTALIVLATVGLGLRRAQPAPLRNALVALGGLVVVQYLLGVVTLLHAAPAGLATAHQAVAVLLLTAAIVALHAARPAETARTLQLIREPT
jgi:cytochrome c oxidase assembly protein subunit 15